MMLVFEKDDRIAISDGSEAIIVGDRPLGCGGQGEVYKVVYNGKEYAMKWYTSPGIIEDGERFQKNIDDNIRRGSPGDCFIWPKYLTKEMDGRFGYLMDVIPQNYSSFSDILRTYRVRTGPDGRAIRDRVGFTSLDTMVLSALKMVRAFMELQRMGLS